jgi:glycosyltransferase involved in cell wall biosynthesis
MDKKREIPKVLILYNKLFHYRLKIFQLLAEKCELTVAYSLGNDTDTVKNYKIIRLPVIKFSRFVIHKDNIFNLCQSFDVVIAYGDIAWLKYSTLSWHLRRKFKVIFWTIGVSASYDKRFDQIKKWDWVRNLFYKKADALLFYSDYPIKGYIKNGYIKDKLFVAHNTVEVLEFEENNVIQKDSLLFIGSLYMEKGLLLLLESYKTARTINKNVPVLNIVGGGEEFNTVKDWINKYKLSDSILLHGPIFEIEKKAEFFRKAYACISPDQAGLSVLESMGYGVPFITSKNSITGGERLNIEDGVNGILFDNSRELADILIDISNFPLKYIKMGEKAKIYYQKCRKPVDMVNGIYNAIQYVLK